MSSGVSRKVTRTRRRRSSSDRRRWDNSNRVGLVAQCRSSTTNRTGAVSDTALSQAATASKRRYRSVSGSDRSSGARPSTRSSTSGTSRTSSPARRPEEQGGTLAQVPAERFHEGLVGNPHAFVAPPEEDRRSGAVGRAGELGRQAALADPGLPGHQHQVPLARACRLPQLIESGELDLPAHEREALPAHQRLGGSRPDAVATRFRQSGASPAPDRGAGPHPPAVGGPGWARCRAALRASTAAAGRRAGHRPGVRSGRGR